MNTPETHAVKDRYARRDGSADALRYNLYAGSPLIKDRLFVFAL